MDPVPIAKTPTRKNSTLGANQTPPTPSSAHTPILNKRCKEMLHKLEQAFRKTPPTKRKLETSSQTQPTHQPPTHVLSQPPTNKESKNEPKIWKELTNQDGILKIIEVQDFGMKISSRKSTMKKKKLENLEHSDKVPTTPPPKTKQVVPTPRKLPNHKPEVSSANPNPKEHGRRKYLNQNLEIDATTPRRRFLKARRIFEEDLKTQPPLPTPRPDKNQEESQDHICQPQNLRQNLKLNLTIKTDWQEVEQEKAYTELTKSEHFTSLHLHHLEVQQDQGHQLPHGRLKNQTDAHLVPTEGTPSKKTKLGKCEDGGGSEL